jgi:prohibitin 2
MQLVNIELRVLYALNTSHLIALHRELGINYEKKVLPSIVNEVVKSVIAMYHAEDLIK